MKATDDEGRKWLCARKILLEKRNERRDFCKGKKTLGSGRRQSWMFHNWAGRKWCRGLETPFGWSRNEPHPQSDTYYAYLGGRNLYCMWFFSLSVLHGSPFAFSRLPLILYFLSPTSPFSSPSTSTYADGTELSHSASISHDRPDGRRPKEKKISSVLPAGTDRVYIWSKVLSSSCPFIYLFLFFNSYSNVFVFVLVRCRNDDSIFESLLFLRLSWHSGS